MSSILVHFLYTDEKNQMTYSENSYFYIQNTT
jgi:hypothetical protein